MNIFYRKLRSDDNISPIINLWKKELLKSQSDKENTIKYINNSLRNDMKDIYNNYPLFELAFNNDTIIGFGGILYCNYHNRYLLSRLVVDSNYRRCRIGITLCHILIANFKHQYPNIDKLYVSVDKNNIPSISLLTKLGFLLQKEGKNIKYLTLSL